MNEVVEASVAACSAYADRIGADYALLRGNVFRENLDPPCQKVAMLSSTFDNYDQVVMLDSDMLPVKGLAENVFEVEGTGLFSEYTKSIFLRCQQEFPDLTDPRYAYWGGAIYKMSRELRQELRRHIREDEITRFAYRFHD